jgi:hypothetical protein
MEMEKYLKSKISGLYKLIEVKKIDSKYFVDYIEVSNRRNDRTPIFSIKCKEVDLISQYRDNLLEQILASKKEDLEYYEEGDILESRIYSEENLKILKKLRNDNLHSKSRTYNLKQAKVDWSKNFEIGERVYYKGYHGIITFKHQMRNDYEPQEWSVKCSNIEYRYITGALLSKREASDLSGVKIDDTLVKLSTEKLLKMYKKSLKIGKGRGNRGIKKILNMRENLNKVDTIINVR